MADLKPHILRNAIDWVYAAFFYSDFTQQMQTLPDEALFGQFVTTLNNTFETEFAQEDKGYESGSESLNIPTPLSRALRVYHVSTMEDLSFNPANFRQSPTSPEHLGEHSPWGYRHCSFSHCQSVFTSSEDESPVRPQNSSTDANSPAHRGADLSAPENHNQHHYCTSTQNMEKFFTDVNGVAWDYEITFSEENFPTAPLDDEVWSEDPILDRQLCIHETPHKPNHQCSYPCPYSTTSFRIDLPQSTPQDAAVFHYEQMDFGDISSDVPDIMTTTSDDDIPDLEDILDSAHLDNIQHRVWFA